MEKLRYLLAENLYKGPENELTIDQEEDSLSNRSSLVRNIITYLHTFGETKLEDQLPLMDIQDLAVP